MVPKAAVTADAPEFVNARPLASVCRTKVTELETATLTAIVAEAEVAVATPVQQNSANNRSADVATSSFTNVCTSWALRPGRKVPIGRIGRISTAFRHFLNIGRFRR